MSSINPTRISMETYLGIFEYEAGKSQLYENDSPSEWESSASSMSQRNMDQLVHSGQVSFSAGKGTVLPISDLRDLMQKFSITAIANLPYASEVTLTTAVGNYCIENIGKKQWEEFISTISLTTARSIFSHHPNLSPTIETKERLRHYPAVTQQSYEKLRESPESFALYLLARVYNIGFESAARLDFTEISEKIKNSPELERAYQLLLHNHNTAELREAALKARAVLEPADSAAIASSTGQRIKIADNHKFFPNPLRAIATLIHECTHIARNDRVIRDPADREEGVCDYVKCWALQNAFGIEESLAEQFSYNNPRYRGEMKEFKKVHGNKEPEKMIQDYDEEVRVRILSDVIDIFADFRTAGIQDILS